MKTEGKRGNPNWGKPLHISIPAAPSSFESLVKALGLAPHQYYESDQLKDWVRKNCHSKYVPVDLLTAWGFTVSSEV